MNYRNITLRITSFLLLTLITLLQSSCKQSQTEPEKPAAVTKITGRISHKTLGIGISHAQVTTTPATSTVFTDTSGYYEITGIFQGTYSVKAEKKGYEETQVNATAVEGSSVKTDIKMSETNVEADAIRFTLYSSGDYVVTSVFLDWAINPLPSANFASFKVYKDTYPDVTQGSDLAAVYTDYNKTFDTLKNLQSNNVYYFRVYAINKQGLAFASSNIIKVRTGRPLGTWIIQNPGMIGLGSAPKSIYPLNDNNVWTVGSEVWNWNGGTWTRYQKPFGITKLNAVYFSDQNNGYAVGEKGEVMKFNGTEWTKINDASLGTNNFYDVVLSSSNDVWISGDDGLFHFDGSKWSKFSLDGWNFSFDMVSSNEIWAIDNSSQIFLYTNGQWKKLTNRSNSYSLTISVVNSNNVWVDIGGKLYQYDGSKLNARGLEVYLDIYGVEMAASNEGWAYGATGGLLHYDGEEWKWIGTSYLSASARFTSLRMLSAKSGWGIIADNNSSTGTSVVRYSESAQ